METIIVICKNKDCYNEFRIPEFKFNSTIRNNPDKQECRICKNKKILSQSNLYGYNKKSTPQTSKYTIRNTNGKKRLKTPRERFYSSSAWKWFSRYVLIYYSIDGEVVKCCTSGKYMRVNSAKCHVGHYVKVFDGNSTNYSTAFEFKNVGPQSMQDNTFMGGRQDIMAIWLIEQHGKDVLEELNKMKNKVFRLDASTIKSISEEYRLKFYSLLKERKWENPWK